VPHFSVVYFFVSTFNRDATYAKIRDLLERKKVPFQGYTHFVENGINHLESLMEQLDNLPEDKPESDSDSEAEPDAVELVKQAQVYCRFGDEDDPEELKLQTEKKKKKRKPKKPNERFPERIFIFDDLSSALRHKSIGKLVKKNRHYKSMCILSSQNITDLAPETHLQLSYALMFQSFNEDKLKNIYERLDMFCELPEFISAYKFATQEKYNFLYVDIDGCQFRKNFNKLIEKKQISGGSVFGNLLTKARNFGRKKVCSSLTKPLFPGEKHLPCHNYSGPGTQYRKRQARGDQPINGIDYCSMIHDGDYDRITNSNMTKEQKVLAVRDSDFKALKCYLQRRKPGVVDGFKAAFIGIASKYGIERTLSVLNTKPTVLYGAGINAKLLKKIRILRKLRKKKRKSRK
jgi:hypothetical protein